MWLICLREIRPNLQKKQDSGYLSISKRIRFKLGPLFQLWNILGKVRKANCKEPVDCNKLVTLVEQTVVCWGQASQSVDHQRRMSLMTRIIPKPKKCLVILARNDKVLMKSKELFGAAFYTALHKYAKGNKQLREAKRELQSFKRRSGPQHRPFRQGPPQQQSGFRGGTDNQVAVTQTRTEVLATLEAEAVEASPGEMTGTCKVGLSPNAQKKNAITLSDSVSLQDTYGLIDGLIAPIKQLGLADITTNLTGGRLTQFLSNWCLITQDSWVLQVIKAQWANGGGGLQSATSQHGGHQNRRTRQRLVKWFLIVTHSQKCTHRLIWVGRTVCQKFAINEALIVSHEHFVFSAGGGGLTAVR